MLLDEWFNECLAAFPYLEGWIFAGFECRTDTFQVVARQERTNAVDVGEDDASPESAKDTTND